MNLPDEKGHAIEALAMLSALCDMAGDDQDKWEALRHGCLAWVINNAHLFTKVENSGTISGKL